MLRGSLESVGAPRGCRSSAEQQATKLSRALNHDREILQPKGAPRMRRATHCLCNRKNEAGASMLLVTTKLLPITLTWLLTGLHEVSGDKALRASRTNPVAEAGQERIS
jgi:hypothetical protein